MAGTIYEMTGEVKTLFDTMSFASGFTKREFLITMDDDFPQDIKFTCIKEKVSLLDRLNPGNRVKVAFRIRCREYQGRYYTDLEAFRVELLDSNGASVTYDEMGPDFEDDESPF